MNILISLIIGLIAAIIDITPMVIKKLDRVFILSAFSFWVIMGLIIPETGIIPIPWLNGVLVALLIQLPMQFLIARLDRKAIPIILATTAVLGGFAGFTSALFLN